MTKKRRSARVKLQCTVGPMLGKYIDWLLATGIYGSNRAAVVRTMLCKGVMDSIPGDVVRKIVAKHNRGGFAKWAR